MYDSLVQEQHAAALDKGPDSAGAHAAEPAGDAFGAVDDLEASEDGRGLEGDGTGFGAVGARGRGGDVSFLRVRVACVRRVGARVDLCLETGLDDVEGTCDDSGETSGKGTGQHLQSDADVSTFSVLASPRGELFPEHEL